MPQTGFQMQLALCESKSTSIYVIAGLEQQLYNQRSSILIQVPHYKGEQDISDYARSCASPGWDRSGYGYGGGGRAQPTETTVPFLESFVNCLILEREKKPLRTNLLFFFFNAGRIIPFFYWKQNFHFSLIFCPNLPIYIFKDHHEKLNCQCPDLPSPQKGQKFERGIGLFRQSQKWRTG